ncbi:MAG: acyltransferase [Flavobacteriaceae bacterium]
MKVGKNTYISSKVGFISPWKIEIGSHCCINQNCLIDGRRGLKICDNVDVAVSVKIFTLQHDPMSTRHECVGAPVTILNNVWIATDATLLPGIEIGEKATIACNTLVTKDVPSGRLYGGIPAKDIGSSAQEKTIRPEKGAIRIS